MRLLVGMKKSRHPPLERKKKGVIQSWSLIIIKIKAKKMIKA